MITRAAGIAVAASVSVPRVLLVWLTLALLLFALGRLSLAGDEMAIVGFVTATDQEASEGYFGIGGDALIVVKPVSGVQRWLQSHSGQRIRITLALDGETP